MATTTASKQAKSTDAIVLLKEDHKEVLRTFREFEKAGEDAHKEQGRLVDRIIELLTVHTYIENEVMYPRVRKLLPDLEDDVLESYEEHHVADVLVMELANMRASAGRTSRRSGPSSSGRGGRRLAGRPSRARSRRPWMR